MRDWSKKNTDFLNIGHNYRMPELIATLLIESLKVLKQDLKKKNMIVKRYITKLNKNVKFCNYNEKKHFHSYYVFSILVQQREKLVTYLKKKKIETNIIYPYSLPFCKHFENSLNFSKKNIALPTYPEITMKKVDYICRKINQFYKSKI